MKKLYKSLSLIACCSLLTCCSNTAHTVDISGKWSIKLDPSEVGVEEEWFRDSFSDEVTLPGAIQAQGYGETPSPSTKWWTPMDLSDRDPSKAKYSRDDENFKIGQFLMPTHHYIGSAWFTRSVNIPNSMEGKKLTLSLERCHWQTQLWVDGEYVGVEESLATPHTYDITKFGIGRHTISLKVDNSAIYNLGAMAHSVSEQTQGTWNGIVGEMLILGEDRVSISAAKIYPDIDKREVVAIIEIDNAANSQSSYIISLDALGYNCSNSHDPEAKIFSGKLSGVESEVLSLTYPIGEGMELWDEFDPNLYKMAIELKVAQNGELYSDSEEVSFGMRKISSDGRSFYVNDIKTFMRGNVDCALYPNSGYAPMSVDEWKRLFAIYKDYGLNFVRCHSWCPPKEAFIAADMVGIYIAPEVHEWSGVKDVKEHKFFKEESAKMLSYLASHPSFVMLGLGNEMFVKESIAIDLIRGWKEIDSTRLYTAKASSSSNPLNDIDYEILGHIKDASFEGGRIRARYQAFWPPIPEHTLFNTLPPQTSIDWSEALSFQHKNYDTPIMSHELAQFCAYPDIYNEIAKYRGYLRPAYLEIAADQLAERGMTDQIADFVENSGKWQRELTKEEIEAAIRTPDMAGFNWLGLNDFTGQNNAPVGFVDAFYEPKSFVDAEWTRRFIAPTVLLARLEKRVFETDDTFTASFEVSNHFKESINLDDFKAEVVDEKGAVVAEKSIKAGDFAQGNALQIGSISLPLATLPSPAKYNLRISSLSNSLSNDWDFWLFPNEGVASFPASVAVVSTWDSNTLELLESGKTVLLLPEIGTLKGDLPTCFTTTYWTSFGSKGGQSSACGVMMDSSHPLFASFPTDDNCSWQWWDILNNCQPMILDQFEEPHPFPKEYRPIVQPIDSWKLNRKLALILEAKVGNGELIICSVDLNSDIARRPASKQLRKSLIEYISSDDFNPQTEIDPTSIAALFEKSESAKGLNMQGLPTEG